MYSNTKVDHEGAPDAGGDAFVCEQLHHVEQVAWVLSIHCGDEFAAVYILQ